MSMLNNRENRGNLIILSGPSAVGKGTVLRALLEEYDEVCYSVSATTREPREGEIDGVHYFFMSQDEFRASIKNDEFIEWAKVHNNYYGTPRNYVEETLKSGKDVILEIDIQGARQVAESFSEGVFVFLAPPSMEELKSRIYKRGTETEDAIQTRMSNATKELEEIDRYDYLIINDEVENAVDKLKSIIIAERCKI
ncbi:guanylate kinase [Orenia metallireducens]|uniref:Guanylate kinase n=2 Tax=Orenia metallireducens TaxID=1413210 RepID=A0A285HQT7_9FIRM|nr:guanylate kinase [Orenia metallireducens]SNY38068.1 guanylate kinase [Orenia metallireducens]